MSTQPDRQPIGIGRFVATNPTEPKAREFLLLKATATIGSDESNDFVIRDDSVSRRHAAISFAAGQLKIEDLGSTNGTFVNGKRISGIVAFDKGDKIRIGGADFVFLRNAAATAATPAPQLADRASVGPADSRNRRRRVPTKRIGERSRLASLGSSTPLVCWLVKPKVTIGAATDNDLVLTDKTASQKHAIVKRRFRKYSLTDLDSTNGTFINERRVRSRQLLAKGDEIRFGSARYAFLQSPTTRELRSRIAPRTKLAILALVLIAGFAAAEHYINTMLSEKLASASRSESTASTKLASEQAEAKTNIAKARSEAEQPAWLRRVNYYRGLAKLPLVSENPSLTRADYLHARYLVKYQLRTHTDHFAHSEDPGDPYYTAEGLAAAKSSNVGGPSENPTSGEQAIDEWMIGAFHRLGILNPGVREAGFGTYKEGGLQVVALYLPSLPSSPRPYALPIEFPPTDSAVPIAVFSGQNEWPNPLVSCAGYVAPTGLAVTLQLGAWIPVEVTAHSFIHDGVALEHCVFDATTYTNPDQTTQDWARQGLKGSSAVILIPRSPLTSGERYNVSITANSQTYAWSFTVE